MRAFVICGPTSSGKSEIALGVAKALSGEIVNADSRQVYRHLSIGTGVPEAEALSRAPHHGYAIVEPVERYSAARFVEDAGNAIEAICGRGHLPIVVGGTGFYIEALTGTMTLDRPPAHEALRARLRAESGVHPPSVLWDWLAALDPSAAAVTRNADTYRIVRRLEAVLAARESRDSELHPAMPQTLRKNVKFVIAVLLVPRETLRARIAARVRQMFARGLIAEAVHAREHSPEAPALTGLGYAEALAYHDGLATYEEALATAITRTVQYAKRQQTWFRRMHGVTHIAASDIATATESAIAAARELYAAT